MSTEKLECYVLPTKPLPLILPVESIAEIVAKPVIEPLTETRANWMLGHAKWRNQRLPVMSYGGLHDPKLDDSKKRNPVLVVLNPIPNAARKAYSAILCHGEVEQLAVQPDMDFGDVPAKVDRRYIEAVIKSGETDYIVPKLDALGVAFSYF